MTEPLVVVSTFKVKTGQLEGQKKFFERYIEFIEAHEPQMLSFNGFLDEDQTTFTSIQVHADTASMETHMKVLSDNWESFKEFADFMEPVRIDYYGSPPQSALDMDADSPFPIGLNPTHIAGFTRPITPAP